MNCIFPFHQIENFSHQICEYHHYSLYYATTVIRNSTATLTAILTVDRATAITTITATTTKTVCTSD